MSLCNELLAEQRTTNRTLTRNCVLANCLNDVVDCVAFSTFNICSNVRDRLHCPYIDLLSECRDRKKNTDRRNSEMKTNQLFRTKKNYSKLIVAQAVNTSCVLLCERMDNALIVITTTRLVLAETINAQFSLKLLYFPSRSSFHSICLSNFLL